MKLFPTIAQIPNPAPSGAEDIRPIRDAVEIPVPPTETSYLPLALQILAGILAAAAVVALILWLRRRAAANRIPNLQKIALKQLEAARSLMTPEHSRDYAIEISNILRNFIEKRFHLPSTRQTTEEFLRDLTTKTPTDLGPYQYALTHFFQQSDIGKFSSHSLTPDEMRALEASARDVIQSESQPSNQPSNKSAH